MDPLSIKSLLLGQSELYQALRSSIFHFRDQEIPKILANFEEIHESWRTLEEGARLYQIPLEKLEVLGELIDRLTVLLPSSCENAVRFDNVLTVIREIFDNGASLIEEHTLLTGLTSGFSLTGSRDHVHDDHFNRLCVYSLSDKHLGSLDTAIAKLLSYGQLVAIDDSTAEPGGEIQQDPDILDGIQTILVAFGLGMSGATTPNALYVQLPAVWQGIQDVARKFAATMSFVAQLQRCSDVAGELGRVRPEIEVLIANARQGLSDVVSLEGIFGTKKGVKQLRATLDQVRL